MNDARRVADGPQHTPACCLSYPVVVHQEHKRSSGSGRPCSIIDFLDGHPRACPRPVRPDSVPVSPRIGKEIRIRTEPAVYVPARPIPPFCLSSLRPGVPDLQAAYQIRARTSERRPGQGRQGTEPQITAHSRRVQQPDAAPRAAGKPPGGPGERACRSPVRAAGRESKRGLPPPPAVRQSARTPAPSPFTRSKQPGQAGCEAQR